VEEFKTLNDVHSPRETLYGKASL
ncbi:MAG: hypothetical protein RL378_557, partial [Actinomycetota bacterium]